MFNKTKKIIQSVYKKIFNNNHDDNCESLSHSSHDKGYITDTSDNEITTDNNSLSSIEENIDYFITNKQKRYANIYDKIITLKNVFDNNTDIEKIKKYISIDTQFKGHFRDKIIDVIKDIDIKKAKTDIKTVISQIMTPLNYNEQDFAFLFNIGLKETELHLQNSDYKYLTKLGTVLISEIISINYM